MSGKVLTSHTEDRSFSIDAVLESSSLEDNFGLEQFQDGSLLKAAGSIGHGAGESVRRLVIHGRCSSIELSR